MVKKSENPEKFEKFTFFRIFLIFLIFFAKKKKCYPLSFAN